MKKILLTLVAVLGFSFASFAQGDEWGIGLRFGSPSGITLKRYMGNNAWDLSVGGTAWGHHHRHRGGGLDAMFTYQWVNPLGNVDGLYWYYGIGGLVSTRRYYDYNSNIGISAMGAIGLEFFIPGAPISVSLEVNPGLSILPGIYTQLHSGLGVRYTF